MASNENEQQEEQFMGSSISPPVILERMPQQSGPIGNQDDWTGVASSAERRKLQNRVNQRAHRKRKRIESGDLQAKDDIEEMPRSETENRDVLRLFHSTYGSPRPDRAEIARFCKLLGPLETGRIIIEFDKWVKRAAVMDSPAADSVLVLVKLNVCRGMITNGNHLGYHDGEGVDDDDAESYFTDPLNAKGQHGPIPESLRPTALQRQIPHHPWIDVLPSPEMRDNLLRAGDTYDEFGLCIDLCGHSSGRTGMIIWRDPWDISGWEVTELYLRDWGWTIRGCVKLFQATNYWREKRGERPLQFGHLQYQDVTDQAVEENCGE